jgi:hypothetical protein
MFVTIVILTPLAIAGYRHTSIAFRYSWEPSPTWAYLKDKIVPIVVGALLGTFTTLLGLYIKHKYWP